MHAQEFFHRIGTLLDDLEASDLVAARLGVSEACDRVVDALLQRRASGHKVLLIGNGGSAAIAGHMEMDLCNRVGVRATVFHDPPVLTALANDHGYDSAFERMVDLWITDGDVLIAISSSGRSPNILRAVAAARKRHCAVFTLSGFDGDNPLRAAGDLNFYVPSHRYGEVEVAHHALGHFLTDRAAECGAAA